VLRERRFIRDAYVPGDIAHHR